MGIILVMFKKGKMPFKKGNLQFKKGKRLYLTRLTKTKILFLLILLTFLIKSYSAMELWKTLQVYAQYTQHQLPNKIRGLIN